MVSILEECRVSPAPGAVGEQSLPLTFSDLMLIHVHLVQNLFFYKFSHSTTHFIDTTIPSLKHSLSLALKHFYPFAGNLLFPLSDKEPEIHYAQGDSVSLIFVESDSNFDYLIKNDPKEVARFHPLIPQLPQVSVQDGTLVAPVLAVQVTIFPNSGICLGFTMNHAAADCNAFVRFIKLWGTIHKSQAEPIGLDSAILPSYDRSTVVKQTKTFASLAWQNQKKIKFEEYQPLRPSSNFVATFVLSETELLKLKNKVKVKSPTLSHISSFTVACAYTWACIVKARAGWEEGGSENELELLGITVDCRAHLDTPLPDNYFGNCIIPCVITAHNGELMNEDGFIRAANIIGEEIRERIRGGKDVVAGLEKMLPPASSASLKRERAVVVTGSPKFAVYDIDFGWGKLQKREYVTIDETRAISIVGGKDNTRDMEIGYSLPKTRMDDFASIFWNGLMVDDI